MRQFNDEHFWKIPTRILEPQQRLENIQLKLLVGYPTVNLFEEEKSLGNELYDLKESEESIWHQKARIDWLRDGDRNTKFFFNYAKGRYARNSITTLYTKDGTLLSSYEAIGQEAMSYFQSLIGTKDGNVLCVDSQSLKRLLPTRLSDSEGAQLIEPITVLCSRLMIIRVLVLMVPPLIFSKSHGTLWVTIFVLRSGHSLKGHVCFKN